MEETNTASRVIPRDLETTYDLLQATLPSIKSPDTNLKKDTLLSTPVTIKSGKTPSPYICSSEDEIFFGTPTEKEKNGKSAKEVQNWTKTKNGRRRTLRMDTTKWRRRKSAYNVENSIEEENENEENCPPSLTITDGSNTVEKIHDSKEKAKLESVISQLANLNSPLPNSPLQNVNKGSFDDIQTEIETAQTLSPIPSPRKTKNVLTNNDVIINHGADNEAIFGERLVSENVIPSFKQLASENESIHQDKSSPGKRNYRSRSPLFRGDVSLEEAKPLIQEKDLNSLQNVSSKETEELINPTPKIRTKYFDSKSDDCSDSLEKDKEISQYKEVSKQSKECVENELTLKWKRRSIRQPNCDSEDDEPDQNLPALNEDNDSQDNNLNTEKTLVTLQNSMKGDKEIHENDADTNAKLQLLLNSETVSDAESSIIDVNNDQMFDDTVFTDYDDMNISRMTQKMSKHWRNKFESESKVRTKKKKDNMSLEELVNSQSDKNSSDHSQSNVSNHESIHNITNNRARRKKPIPDVSSDLQLSGSDIVCKTVVNETPPSVNSSIATESEKGNCVSEEKNDICPANESKDTILMKENNDDDKALFQKESSSMAEQDDSNLSTCSDWFNTTREEMILYEKFGEDYDVVVEKMTKEEKIRLKEEVSKASPKKVEELLGENEAISKNYNQNEISSPENKVEKAPSFSLPKNDSKEISSQVSNRSSDLSDSFTSNKPTIENLNNTEKSTIKSRNDSITTKSKELSLLADVDNNQTNNEKKFQETTTSISTSLESLGEEIKNKAEKNKCLQELERSNNSSKSYSIDEINSDDVILRSNDNSLLARVQKAQADIRKDNASDNCKGIINLKNTPTQNQHKEKKIFGTPSMVKDFKFKTPTSGKTAQSTLRTAHYSSGNHFGTKINHGSGPKSIPSYQRDTKASTLKRSPAKNKTKATPTSGNIFPSPLDFGSKRGLPSSVVDMDKIISPISQYINANPVPPTMKHIRPKTSKFLDFEIQDAVNHQNSPSPKTSQAAKKIFAPLPAANYCSSKVAVQIPVAPDNELKELPRAFGITNTVQAKVVKHLGRTKVPRSLAQQEIIKASENLKTLSPNAIPIGVPTIHQRESTLFSRESNIGGTSVDQSTMEMSVQETKEIKKPTSSTLERKLL